MELVKKQEALFSAKIAVYYLFFQVHLGLKCIFGVHKIEEHKGIVDQKHFNK